MKEDMTIRINMACEEVRKQLREVTELTELIADTKADLDREYTANGLSADKDDETAIFLIVLAIEELRAKVIYDK